MFLYMYFRVLQTLLPQFEANSVRRMSVYQSMLTAAHKAMWVCVAMCMASVWVFVPNSVHLPAKVMLLMFS